MKPKDVPLDLRADIGGKGDKFIIVNHLMDPTVIKRMESMRNAKWIPPERAGGPGWRFPLALDVGVRLREEFGDQLKVSKRLHTWARKKKDRKDLLIKLASTTTGDLPHLEDLDPDLYQAIFLGPIGLSMTDAEKRKAMKVAGYKYTKNNKEVEFPSFQTADVAYMVEAQRCMNGNHPGTGKTLETIAAAVEVGLCDPGMKKLVIAPLTSLDTVWEPHLLEWQWNDVILGAGAKPFRDTACKAATQYAEDGEAFWFVTNPNTIQYQAVYEEDELTGRRIGIKELWLKHPELHKIDWDLIVIDEYHSMGLGRPDSLTARSVFDLPVKPETFIWWLSGTPIGGRPIKLYPPLHHFDPEEFDSKWKFADMWMEVDRGERTVIGNIREEEQERFDSFLSQYMVRRTKDEVLPWLPPKHHIQVWCNMTPAQEKQYKEFALAAEIKIDDENLSATSILAEYTRLKQFADSKCRIVPRPMKDGKPQPPMLLPLEDSCKLDQAVQILDELGIMEGEGDEQCVIISQFTEMVDMVYGYLTKKGVPCVRITGKVTTSDRTENIKQFQSKDTDRPRVMLLNTKAGGVSITLDNASTVIILDETWVPDDQEQAEDRVHRASRIHQVTVYTLITRKTIEEYIIKLRLEEKASINKRILDIRRKLIKAAHGA